MIILWLLLSIALAQGMFYLLLIPPWQHYDEPTHFEYAWVLARQDDPREPPAANGELRQQLLASMIEHDFFHDATDPTPGWWFIATQLGDPPYYYALVSYPLRYVQDSPLVHQLYVARAVSLILFLLTIAACIGTLWELTPPNHPLRWGLPLALILLPPFVDFMTAVNNNVGAICFSSWFLWGAVRLVHRGFSPVRVVWVIAAALIATAIKNIAAFTLLLVPVVFLVALLRAWGWRWVLVVNGGLALVAAAIVVGWGDAALWYRWYGAPEQEEITRVATAHAPLGTFVIQLTADSSVGQRRLLAPILDEGVQAANGNIVTVGGWVWAEETTRVALPTLALSTRPGEAYRPLNSPTITATTTPQFVAWHVGVPEQIGAIHYVFSIAPPKQQQDQKLFLDGAVLAVGAYPVEQAPEFDDSSAQQGTWAGVRFANLVRNASAEQAAPRLRSWVQDSELLNKIDPGWGRTPSLLLAALWDTERSLYLMYHYAGVLLIDSLATRLAWGHITLSSGWVWLFRAIVLVGVVGSVRWLIGGGCRRQARACAALIVPVVALVLVWGFTLTRILPKISEGVVYPLAHYAFPAIIPTMVIIIAGWWTLFPVKLRWYALVAVLGGMFMLNGAALWTLWQFYYAG